MKAQLCRAPVRSEGKEMLLLLQFCPFPTGVLSSLEGTRKGLEEGVPTRSLFPPVLSAHVQAFKILFKSFFRGK